MTVPASSQAPLAGLTNYTGSPLQASVVRTAQDLFDAAELSAAPATTSQVPHTQTRIGAFIVLAHAQLEDAIEQACRSALQRLHSSAPNNVWQGWNSFLVHSVDSSALAHLKVTKSQTFPPAGRLLLQFLTQDFAAKVIDRNNGISGKYLTNLFAPLGLDLSAHVVDINTLTTFAGLRGPVAHTGKGPIQQSSPLSVVNQGVAAAFAVDNISQSASRICSSAVIPSIAPLASYGSWWRRALIRVATW